VEDNPEDSELLKEVIAALNPSYRPVVAENGVRALDLLKEHEFSLVLLDINLGGAITGRSLLFHERMKGKRVFIVSGIDEMDLKVLKVQFRNVLGYFQKPIEIDRFRKILSNALAQEQIAAAHAQEAETGHVPQDERPAAGVPAPGGPFWKNLLPRVTRQKKSWIVLEAAALIALAASLWFSAHPGWNYTKEGPVMACLCEKDLWIIDPQGFRVLNRAQLPGSSAGLEASKDGESIFVALNSRKSILAINSLHGRTVRTIPLGDEPSLLRMGEDQKHIYCLNRASKTISRISIDESRVTSTMLSGARPLDMIPSPDGKSLYVSDRGNESINLMDVITARMEGSVRIPGGAGPMAVNPFGYLLYVCNRETQSVTIVDTQDRRRTGEISGVEVNVPQSMLFSRDGKYLFIANAGSNNLAIVDPEAKRYLMSVRVGREPVDIAEDPKGRIWVVNRRSHSISVVEPKEMQVKKNINVGDRPVGIKLVP
jgi:YVTN family beta-propeller protein